MGTHNICFYEEISQIISLSSNMRFIYSEFDNFLQGISPIGFHSYRSWPETWNFGISNRGYYTIYAVKNEEADQTAGRGRLI